MHANCNDQRFYGRIVILATPKPVQHHTQNKTRRTEEKIQFSQQYDKMCNCAFGAALCVEFACVCEISSMKNEISQYL